MKWLILCLLPSSALATINPIPSDSQPATDANFREIDTRVSKIDLTDGGTISTGTFTVQYSTFSLTNTTITITDGGLRLSTTTGNQGITFQDNTMQTTAGGGLTSTQTWTGANTFRSSVTTHTGGRDIIFSTGTAAGSVSLSIQGTTGNVGILTSSPGYGLHVASNAIVTSTLHVGRETVSNSCSSASSCSASCSAGKLVTGGGCAVTSGSSTLLATYPSSTTVWQCNTAASVTTLVAYAVCARVGAE